jgi:MFS family permease
VLENLAVHFGLSTFQKELVPSSMVVGAIVGSAVGGVIMDRIGRRDAIILSGFIFFFASSTCAAAPTFIVLLSGRFFLGIAVAIALIADTTYLLEVSPTEWRGALVSCNEFMLAVGIMFAFTCGATVNNWRFILAIPAVIALVQIFAMFSMPRSPRWLAQQGRNGDAMDALACIYPDRADQEEAMKGILTDIRGGDCAIDANGPVMPTEADFENEFGATHTQSGPMAIKSQLRSTIGTVREFSPPPQLGAEDAEDDRDAACGAQPVTLCGYARPELVICLTMVMLSQLTGNPLVMSYACTVLMHCTHALYSCTVLMHCTHALYSLCTVRMHCTHYALYSLCTVLTMHCTHALYSLCTVLTMHCTHTLYSYTAPGDELRAAHLP